MTGELCVGPAHRTVDGGTTAAAFDDYVHARQLALVRYATLLSGSQAQAEDLVQDVLIRLYPRWAELTGQGDPHAYVRRCVTNEYLSWRRRWSTRHIHAVPDRVLEDVADPDTDDTSDPELWARLLRLPRQQRAAVVLRFWEGLDDAEIGEVLSCRPVTVRAHVSRGLATLRIALTTSGQEGTR